MSTQRTAPDIALDIPSQWDWNNYTHEQAVAEIDRCAGILARGAEALSGLYVKICTLIRRHGLTDSEIRDALSRHFPPPRVSEFITIAHAPDEVFRRYHAGFVGFRATLNECRYKLHSDAWRRQRTIRRTAERLIHLLGQGTVEVLGHRVTVA